MQTDTNVIRGDDKGQEQKEINKGEAHGINTPTQQVRFNIYFLTREIKETFKEKLNIKFNTITDLFYAGGTNYYTR